MFFKAHRLLLHSFLGSRVYDRRGRLGEVDDGDHFDQSARLARHLVADPEPDLLRYRQHIVRLRVCVCVCVCVVCVCVRERKR